MSFLYTQLIDGTNQTIKKLNAYLERNDRKTIFFFSIVLCLLSCFCIIGGNTQRYALNDDIAMNHIAIGNRGEQNRPYLPFCNICYGYLLYALYEMTECVNWYAVFPILMSVLALIVLTVTLAKISEHRLAPLAVLIFVWMFGKLLFVLMTFTYFASFFSAVGLFLVYLSSIKLTGRWKILITIIGTFFGLIGYWIRSSCFISVAVVIVVCAACQFLRIAKNYVGKKLKKTDVKKTARKIVGFAWGFLLLGCFVWISYQINSSIYNSSEDWTFWRQFNSLRASLIDYNILEYELYSADYNAIGIDELDYDFFFSLSFADLNKFNLDTLQKMNNLRLQTQKESFSLIGSIYTFLKSSYSMIKTDCIIFIPMIIGAVLTFCRKRNLWLLLPIFVGLAECYYISIKGRYIFRAITGILFIVSLLLILSLSDRDSVPSMVKRKKVMWIYPLFAAGLAIAMIFSVARRVSQEAQTHSDKSVAYDLREILNDDEDCMFVIERPVSIERGSNEALPVPKKYKNNIYPTGGWGIPSPLFQNLLKQYGIYEEGVIKGLYDNQANVYYLTDHQNGREQRMLTYIRRNYDENVSLETVDECQELVICRYYVDCQPTSDAIANASVSSCEIQIEQNNKSCLLNGFCTCDEIDPYKQNVWIRITTKENKKSHVVYQRCSKTLRQKDYLLTHRDHNNASGFTCEIPEKSLKKALKVELVISDGGNTLACEDITDRFQ